MPGNTNFSGFTLIEILVVLTIMAIMTGVVIFNIGAERQNSALLRSAQNLSLNLRRTQNYALSTKEFKSIGVPCGWGVHFNGVGSASYVIFADLVDESAKIQLFFSKIILINHHNFLHLNSLLAFNKARISLFFVSVSEVS